MLRGLDRLVSVGDATVLGADVVKSLRSLGVIDGLQKGRRGLLLLLGGWGGTATRGHSPRSHQLFKTRPALECGAFEHESFTSR